MGCRDCSMRVILGVALSIQLLMGTLIVLPDRPDANAGSPLGPTTATALSSFTPIANAGVDQNVSAGDEVTFNASLSVIPGNGTANYNWSFTYDGVDTKLHGLAPSFKFKTAGEYLVTLNVSEGSHYSTDLVVIRVAAEKAATSSLIYSGGAAVAVAALLIVMFIVMRSSKGDGSSDDEEDESEEEFEET